MYGFAVRTLVAITCAGLLWTDALGDGVVSWLLWAGIGLAAIWKWIYRLVRLLSGAGSAVSRIGASSDDSSGGNFDEQRIDERIRELATAETSPQTLVPAAQAADQRPRFGRRV